MGQPRGPYRVGLERRRAIIDAATDLIGTGGFDQMSLDALAARAGVTLGALQHYFPTRRHLLAAVAEDRLLRVGTSWPPAGDPADPHAILEWMHVTMVQFVRQPGLVELAVRAAAEGIDESSPAHAVMGGLYDSVVQQIGEAFARCAAAGRLRPGLDPETAARLCLSSSDGLQLQWALSGQRLDLRGLAAAALQALGYALIHPDHLDPERLARLADA